MPLIRKKLNHCRTGATPSPMETIVRTGTQTWWRVGKGLPEGEMGSDTPMRGTLPLLAGHTSMLHRSWSQLITVLMEISKSSRSAPPLLNGICEALAPHPRKELPHASSLHRARAALQRAPQNRPGHNKQPGIAAPPPLPQSPLHPRLPRRVHCRSEKVQKHTAAVIS